MAPCTSFDLSLVFACYNEEAVFSESIQQTFEILDNTRWSYEIIFVDDCSNDCTREMIDRLISSDKTHCLSRIFHDHNVGRGGSVADGIRHARGSVVGFVDIDLEVHARYIPVCVLAVQRGADIATAHRIYKFYWKGLVRWLLSHGYMWVEHLFLNIPLEDTETGFKFFRRDKILPVLDEIEDTHWFWDTEVMVRSYLRGNRIVEIPCLFQRRFDKRSTVNPIADAADYFVKLWRFGKVVKRLQNKQDQVDRYWREQAVQFDEHYARKDTSPLSVFVGRFLNERFRRIVSLLDVQPRERVMDVGCGSGYYLELLAQRRAVVTGMDYSDAMLILSHQRLSGTGLDNHSLVCGDASTLPVSDAQYDLILAVGLLDYIADPSSVLREFHRVLCPTGRVIVTFPKSPSPLFFLRTRPGNILRRVLLHLPPILTVLTYRQAEQLLMAAGFTIVRIETVQQTMWLIQAKCSP